MTFKFLKISKICSDSIEIPDIWQSKPFFYLYVFITITLLDHSIEASYYFLYYSSGVEKSFSTPCMCVVPHCGPSLQSAK